MEAAEATFLYDVFGDQEDFGPELLKLMMWHGSRTWDLASATPADKDRADALEANGIVTRMHFRDIQRTIPPLNLRLPQFFPPLALLVYPMAVKVPVITLRYCVETHAAFAFSAIRAARHPEADDIVAYLYDLLFLQQKSAVALVEFLRLAYETKTEKGNALLTKAELRSIMYADLLVAYLKASIEKTLALVAATHGVRNIDSTKTHRARLERLMRELPSGVKTTHYGDFLLEMVRSEHLADLNNYRSGVLHKKGIAKLQPHKYFRTAPELMPHAEVFGVLHAQHTNNSAGLIAALAMLTDELVRRDRPKDAAQIQAELAVLMLENVDGVPFTKSAVHEMGNEATVTD